MVIYLGSYAVITEIWIDEIIVDIGRSFGLSLCEAPGKLEKLWPLNCRRGDWLIPSVVA